jgi:hypothetical protein
MLKPPMPSALLVLVALLAEGAAPALPREPPDPIVFPQGVLSARARALRERATRAYKSKDYPAACALFASAVKLAPEHADLQDELGLCLARLGRKQEALAAHWRAVSSGRLATRLRAYFNLSSLGVEVTPPGRGSCAPLAAPPWCEGRLQACGFSFSECGGRRCFHGEGVRIYSLGVRYSLSRPGTVTSEDVRRWQAAFRGENGCSLSSWDGNEEGCHLDVVNRNNEPFDGVVADVPQRELERNDGSHVIFSPPPPLFDLVLREGGENEAGEEEELESCRIIMADACSGLVAVRCRGGGVLEGVHEVWVNTQEEAPEPTDAGTP